MAEVGGMKKPISMSKYYAKGSYDEAVKESVHQHRASTNKTLLKAIIPYIRTEKDGSVFVKKDIGEFKKGDPLAMVNMKGASLISTDPRFNASWQKMNAKEARKIYSAIMKQKNK